MVLDFNRCFKFMAKFWLVYLITLVLGLGICFMAGNKKSYEYESQIFVENLEYEIDNAKFAIENNYSNIEKMQKIENSKYKVEDVIKLECLSNNTIKITATSDNKEVAESYLTAVVNSCEKIINYAIKNNVDTTTWEFKDGVTESNKIQVKKFKAITFVGEKTEKANCYLIPVIIVIVEAAAFSIIKMFDNKYRDQLEIKENINKFYCEGGKNEKEVELNAYMLSDSKLLEDKMFFVGTENEYAKTFFSKINLVKKVLVIKIEDGKPEAILKKNEAFDELVFKYDKNISKFIGKLKATLNEMQKHYDVVIYNAQNYNFTEREKAILNLFKNAMAFVKVKRDKITEVNKFLDYCDENEINYAGTIGIEG